jgi:hypothetical protein
MDPNPELLPLIDDLDMAGAGEFLAAHHVPIVSPEMGERIINVVKRLEAVREVYPLPSTVEAYKLALHLVLAIATEHQRAFCTRLESALDE